MNKKYIFNGWTISFAIFLGLTTLLSGMFANLIGIDRNNGWGLRRIVVLEAGFLILALAIILLIQWKWKNKTISWAVMFAVIQCLIVYAWYETAGTMKFIDPGSKYYDMQAQAFLHGQLDLLVKPRPELLALPDPYDSLQNAPYKLGDAILYKGKYYLSWGPFPALFLAAIKLLVKRTFADAFLVLLFMVGYVIFMALTIVEIRAKLFPESPFWILVPGVVIGGLMNPVLWLLGRPNVYEAAITGGQLFLIAGIYFALTAFKSDRIETTKLILSGVLLSWAVLSRVSLALAVIWVAICIGYALQKNLKPLHRAVSKFMAFGSPLVLGALLLLIYNTLRFDSPFEFGVKYGLADLNQKQLFESGFFQSPHYILPNLNTYFFRSPQNISEFPFLTAPMQEIPVSLINAALATPGFPNGYIIWESVAGVMVTSPILWLVFLPLLIGILKKHNVELPECQTTTTEGFLDAIWMFHLFGGLVFFAFLPISLVFSSTMRYIFDFSPSLYLLMFLSFLYGYTLISNRLFRGTLIGVFLVLGIVTIINGMLLGFTSYFGHFSTNNPELFNALADFFSFFGN